MSNDAQGSVSVEMAASRACTQSGAFALLLSLALLLLIPNWLQRPRETALARYVTYRQMLSVKMDDLDADPRWQSYRDTDGAADSKPIAEIVWLPVGGVSQAFPEKPSSAHQQASRNRQKKNHPQPSFLPEPPRNMSATVVQGFERAVDVVDYLIKLNDPDLLVKSMQASNFFTTSILRWGEKRSQLLYGNVLLHSCVTTPFEVPTVDPSKPMPDYFAPLLVDDAMLKCLTVRDVRQLASYELPAFPNSLEADGRIQKGVDVRPGSLTGALVPTSAAVQILLAFVLIYFGAFARESTLSSTFPTAGTLFGAFSRSRSTMVAMLIALWAPFIASTILSVISRHWILILCNIPIVLAVLSIHHALNQRAYFSSLRRHAAA